MAAKDSLCVVWRKRVTRVVQNVTQRRKFGKILVSKCDVLLTLIALFTNFGGQKFQMTIFIVLVLRHRSTVISEE